VIRITLKWSVGIIALFTLGCSGGSTVETGPVSGTVYLDDQPLASAEVNFFCADGNFLGSGKTDAQGHYQLYQGAAVGTNKVWITTKKVSDTNPVDESGDFDEPPAEDEQAQVAMTEDESSKKNDTAGGEKVPVKFSNPDSTVLTFNVPSGGADKADFHLTSK